MLCEDQEEFQTALAQHCKRDRPMLFKKKSDKKTYDKENQRPVIKASICNGEQVAGFQDIHTGAFEEVMLIRGNDDLAKFMNTYGIEGKIEKIY